MVGTLANLDVLEEMKTNEGQSLKEISDNQPIMMIFLRHFGCVFCKAAMAEIANKRAEFEEGGIKLIFLHMSDAPTADQYFIDFKLKGVAHVSDPEKKFYRSFGLVRGSFTQLFGLQTWIKGYQLSKKGFQQESGKHLGDSFQMPGVFLIYQGEVKESFVHRIASDAPDYYKLAQCCML